MENRLTHLDEFRKLLADYRIAKSGQKILDETELAFLTGPSASGRDTIINELLKSGEYFHIVSDTTRHPRINNGVPEQSGVEYWFRSEEDMLADLRAGRLLEAEIIFGQQVSGISIRELEKAHDQHKIAITNVDLNIKQIVLTKPDTHAFLVLPPSFDEWMRRLGNRGTMPPAEKHRRLKTASRIFAAGLEWDFFVYIVNHTVADAAAAIQQHIQTGVADSQQQLEGRKVLQGLHKQTQAFLSTSKIT